MTCSDLLIRVIEAGPQGLRRDLISDLPTLEYLQNLKLVTDTCIPYWAGPRIFVRAERTGHYGVIENISSWRSCR
jgi:hypothetical protein